MGITSPGPPATAAAAPPAGRQLRPRAISSGSMNSLMSASIDSIDSVGGSDLGYGSDRSSDADHGPEDNWFDLDDTVESLTGAESSSGGSFCPSPRSPASPAVPSGGGGGSAGGGGQTRARRTSSMRAAASRRRSDRQPSAFPDTSAQLYRTGSVENLVLVNTGTTASAKEAGAATASLMGLAGDDDASGAPHVLSLPEPEPDSATPPHGGSRIGGRLGGGMSRSASAPMLNALRAPADAATVDQAALREAVSWCAAANLEGDPDEAPTRARPLWIIYSAGTRFGLWREIYPFADPLGEAGPGPLALPWSGTREFFRALERADFSQ